MPSASKRWKSSTSLAGMSAQRPLGPAEIGEDAVIEAAFDGNIAQRRAARRDIAPLALGRDHRGRDALRLRRHQLPLRHLDVATGKCALHILAAAVEQALWAQLADAAGEAEGEQQSEGGEEVRRRGMGRIWRARPGDSNLIRPLSRGGRACNRAAPLYDARLVLGRGRSSGVEHNLAKVGVEGSNPFARSNRKPQKTAVFSGFFSSCSQTGNARVDANRTRSRVNFWHKSDTQFLARSAAVHLAPASTIIRL